MHVETFLLSYAQLPLPSLRRVQADLFVSRRSVPLPVRPRMERLVEHRASSKGTENIHPAHHIPPQDTDTDARTAGPTVQASHRPTQLMTKARLRLRSPCCATHGRSLYTLEWCAN